MYFLPMAEAYIPIWGTNTTLTLLFSTTFLLPTTLPRLKSQKSEMQTEEPGLKPMAK